MPRNKTASKELELLDGSYDNAVVAIARRGGGWDIVIRATNNVQAIKVGCALTREQAERFVARFRTSAAVQNLRRMYGLL